MLTTLAFLVSACGSSSHSAARKPTAAVAAYHPSAASLPACAKAGTAIPLPRGFPASFPLPPGTAITAHHSGVGHEVDISGVVPATSFQAAVSFFPRELPKRSFRVTHYEADPERDSEGNFRGHGYVGGWSLRVIPACKALTFTAGAVRTG